MATIGTFTKTPEGYAGTVKTLTLNVKAVLKPTEGDNDKAPQFRIYTGAVEFGAAWEKMSQADKPYLSCKLDDPSFPHPIFATLHANDDETFSLIWTRNGN